MSGADTRGLTLPASMDEFQIQNYSSEEELRVFTGGLGGSGLGTSPLTSPELKIGSAKSVPIQESSHISYGFSEDAIPIPESDIGDADTDQLLGSDDKPKNSSFWSFEYYQQFFDVTSGDVLRRILGSMLPRPGTNFLQTTIRPNPDLYGPVWVAITLIFTTGICGNFSHFWATLSSTVEYQFQFHKVTLAATAIFCYWWLLPTGLHLLFWWRKSRCNVTYLESICLYGYSLAVYIPISFLWIIQNSTFQTMLVIVGMILSGSVLVMTYWPTVKDDDKRIALGLMVGILLFHGLLALGFLLYFFHVSAVPIIPDPNRNITVWSKPTQAI